MILIGEQLNSVITTQAVPRGPYSVNAVFKLESCVFFLNHRILELNGKYLIFEVQLILWKELKALKKTRYVNIKF